MPGFVVSGHSVHKEAAFMRIAQIAPLTEAIPPELYGGTERVVSWLTEELVALGHDVTLFASGNSRTSAKLEAMWPRALRLDDTVRDPMALHIAMLERVRRLANQVRRPALPSRLPAVLGVLAAGHAVHHHHARPPRSPGTSDGVQRLRLRAGHLDLRHAAQAGAAGALDEDDLSRPARGPAGAGPCKARVSRLPRPHCAGEVGRSGDPHRRGGRDCR